MRIIKISFLRAAAIRHPDAARQVETWIRIVRAAKWKTSADLRSAFRDADPVRVRSGHTVWVFNICRNDFRLIAAVHFTGGRVFTLRFLSHAEYDKNQWKEEL